MTAAEAAKAAGLKSLTEASELTGWTTKALRTYYKDNRQRFNIVIAGCVAIKSKKVLK